MNQEGLLALYKYNAYANCILFETAAQLSEAQFTQASSPSHHSVRGLLLHMLEAEAFFLSVCSGQPKDELPGEMTLADIRRHGDQIAKRTHDHLVKMTDRDLMREIEVPICRQPLQLPAWQALVQGFVHSTHHRGELSIVLTELGFPLPTLDIILQFVEQSGQQWPRQQR